MYVLLTWSEFTVLIFKFDRVGRLLSTTVLVCLIYNLVKNYTWRTILTKSPVVIWAMWCIYVAVNVIIQGHKEFVTATGEMVEWHAHSFFLQDIVKQLVILTTIYWMYLFNPKRTFKHLIIIFFSIAIATFMFDSVNKDWGDTGRFGTVMGNRAALTMVTLIFIVALCWLNNWFNKTKLLLVFGIAIALIFAIQTRKALAAVAIICFFTFLSKQRNVNLVTLIKLFILLCFSLVLVYFVMENTSIGERFSTIEEDGKNANELGIPALDWLGDRAFHVYLGWNIFLDYPIFGVGLENAPYYSGLPFPFHQEYIGQLAENGIIGFLLYASFIFILIRNLFIKKLRDKTRFGECLICIGAMLAVLFISFTAWTWQSGSFYVLFGIVAATGSNYQLRNNYGI